MESAVNLSPSNRFRVLTGLARRHTARSAMVVPSTYLWQKAVEDLRVNSLWQRLRRSLLLLLQLLLLALLFVALAGPHWRAMRALGQRRVCSKRREPSPAQALLSSRRSAGRPSSSAPPGSPRSARSFSPASAIDSREWPRA